ncbi:MAG TPA: FAD-dependent oxidoreductase [Anaerolineales bacterium]|nr:FAD-dependent oxidoreductase [Anaerolineales bacterium]HMX18833.1 FAD-dependent oxidoreductase [Anaerolineales bacterium]HMX74984.1 FAD-dependent oxidoreductase [Anaerolineales bacterium]HMZ43675.1 FAD-dependent oxidoreductase [Anaerolineales bacterium]HNA55273.1 FAD-dependent oxidoreductase [Anaerolineales bacterium]
MRYIIIGSGVAGVAAIEAIRKNGMSGEIVMVGDDPHGFYSRPGLAYFLTGELHDKALFPRTREDYVRLHFKFHKSRVTKLLPSEKAIELDGKSHLSYDKLLISVGAQAIPLTVPGANLEGVVKLDHLEDARKILKFARRGKTAVVVGGGITALELAEGLLSRGVKVHYLLRGDRYWSNVLDDFESRIIERRLQEEGVTLHFHTELAEITGRSRVNGIRLKDGRAMRCDMVAYAIGIKPRIELARNAGISVDRGILTNEYLQTNHEDIFAAGDVAQVFDPVTGRSVIDSLWHLARDQGHTAGLNMTGERKTYIRNTPFNVTRLAGLTTTIIGSVGHGHDDDIVGIARGDSETWRQLPDAIVAQSGFDVNRVRLMVGETTLIGAVVMGDQTISAPLQRIVRDRMDITSMRDKLLARDAKIADVIVDFWSKYKTN